MDSLVSAHENGEHVLIIDDDPGVRAVVTDVLECFGFRVTSGVSGNDLERMLAECEDAAAVICDYTLVGENGLELRDRFKAVLDARRIAFILFHGAGDSLSQKLRGLGVRELRKPVGHIDEFETIVREEVKKLRQTT